ncbi:MAG: hypothetical protein MPJ50_18580 [Pirellulales bacterium]|nr:hypothetical protein [Pirellulales bacterium]
MKKIRIFAVILIVAGIVGTSFGVIACVKTRSDYIRNRKAMDSWYREVETLIEERADESDVRYATPLHPRKRR